MQKGVCWEVTRTVTQSGLQAPELSGTCLPSPGARGDRRGRLPWTKLSVLPCPFPSLLFPPPLPGTSPCVLPPGRGLLQGRGWADPSLPHPQWGLSPRAKAPLQLLEERGFFPLRSRILSVFTQVCWELWGLGREHSW